MPSPIAHVAAGYVAYRVAARSPEWQSAAQPGGALLLSTVVLSLLPDVDSVVGVVMGDFGRYHNNVSHSLFVALFVALAVGAVAHAGRERFVFWFTLAFACYGTHIVMDYLTWGRGVMALWPLLPDRFTAPLIVFYGFHWSQGLVSAQHLWTFLTEAPVAAAAVMAAQRLAPVASRG